MLKQNSKKARTTIIDKSPEFDFFLKADLRKYSGKYIAIVGRKVATSGTNAKEVWHRAKKKYPRSMPMLAKLPKEEVLILCW